MSEFNVEIKSYNENDSVWNNLYPVTKPENILGMTFTYRRTGTLPANTPLNHWEYDNIKGYYFTFDIPVVTSPITIDDLVIAFPTAASYNLDDWNHITQVESGENFIRFYTGKWKTKEALEFIVVY